MKPLIENPWAVTEFTTVSAQTSLVEAFHRLMKCRAPYLIVKNTEGHTIAALEASEFLGFWAQIKASRFPGDVGPESLTIKQALSANVVGDFYPVDLDSLHLRPDFWLQGRLARTVLILEQGEVKAIIPRIHFRSWIDNLKREVSPFPSRNSQSIVLLRS